MQFTFNGYEVLDTSVRFEFRGADADINIYLSDAELATVNTPAALRTILEAKLRRKVNREGIASKLDAFIGQSVTI